MAIYAVQTPRPVIAEAHGGGKSFAGVAAYCLKLSRETLDAQRRERRGEPVVVEPVKPSARVEWTDVRNLATTNVRAAARQMAATVQYSAELKRLAGGSQAGRPLAKPVYHYTLSWAKDERPDRAEMSRAVDQSLKALGMEDRQAFVVAHNDRRHPHVHVVVNRVSVEGRPRRQPGQRSPQAVAMYIQKARGICIDTPPGRTVSGAMYKTNHRSTRRTWAAPPTRPGWPVGTVERAAWPLGGGSSGKLRAVGWPSRNCTHCPELKGNAGWRVDDSLTRHFGSSDDSQLETK